MEVTCTTFEGRSICGGSIVAVGHGEQPIMGADISCLILSISICANATYAEPIIISRRTKILNEFISKMSWSVHDKSKKSKDIYYFICSV